MGVERLRKHFSFKEIVSLQFPGSTCYDCDSKIKEKSEIPIAFEKVNCKGRVEKKLLRNSTPLTFNFKVTILVLVWKKKHGSSYTDSDSIIYFTIYTVSPHFMQSIGPVT